jgi:hypothetical protein
VLEKTVRKRLEKDGGQRKKAGNAVDPERAPKSVVIGTIFGSVRDQG